MSVAVTLAVVGMVLVTAGIQRVAGFGFGMVLAPFVVVLIGAHEGVMFTNFISIFAPFVIMWWTWHEIQWRKALWISAAAAVVMPFFAWVSVISPSGPVYVIVAALVLLGLTTSTIVARLNARINGDWRLPQVLAGAAAGAGTVVGGVGAPPFTIYAVLSQWDIRHMVATLQPIWVVISVVSFGSKWLMDDGQLPDMPWWGWAGSAISMFLGMMLGQVVQRKVRERTVKRFVVLLSFAGALLALFTGLRMMFG